MNADNLVKIKDYFEKLGLNEKEIKVYLFLLSRGPQLVSSLAKGCGLTRTHAYDIVKHLESLGLSHSLGSEYGKKIQALSVNQIGDLIDQKERELKSLKNDFFSISDALNSLTNIESHTKPNVAYYYGLANLKKLINLTLHAEEKMIRAAGSELDLIEKLGQEFMINYHLRRADKKVQIQSLRPGIKRGNDEVFRDDKKYLREIRLRPEGEISLKSNMMTWDNYLAVYSLGDEPFGILIENEALSVMMKSWFNFVWSKCPKVK
ncbi:MAG: hypothetical protein NT165_02080 [Candidatus Falkowbacteria bacterium]|nr:hypothetical protein [Candidatus Falkowbacteria bacterium]